MLLEMEERIGPGRPQKVPTVLRKALIGMTVKGYDGGRTITNRYYVTKVISASCLAVGLPPSPANYKECLAAYRQRWPFVWGQRMEGSETSWSEDMHWSLLQELGRWEDSYKIIKMMDTIEYMQIKNVKRAISFSRQCRTGKRAGWEDITSVSVEAIKALAPCQAI